MLGYFLMALPITRQNGFSFLVTTGLDNTLRSLAQVIHLKPNQFCLRSDSGSLFHKIRGKIFPLSQDSLLNMDSEPEFLVIHGR